MHFFKRINQLKKILTLQSKDEKEEKEEETHYLKNGSALLVELISTFGTKYDIPIRHFGAEEIVRATNNFVESVNISDFDGRMYLGCLENRRVLVKKYSGKDESIANRLIRDIAINSQMSHHKNVLKLVGCCLEFEYPALIYEFFGTELLYHLLVDSKCNRSLSWRCRLRIANDIANVVAYLHNAFSTPIIFRDLKPGNVIVDQSGHAKLFKFSISISLPPGELQVADDICGTPGYLDPAYASSGIINQKTDVFSFGVLMLELLTGRRALSETDTDFSNLFDYVISNIGTLELDQIVDSKILEPDGGVEQMQQIQAFLHLTLRCMLPDEESRPFMIDVAKEIQKIGRCPHMLPQLESIKNVIPVYSTKNYIAPSKPYSSVSSQTTC